MPSTKSNTLGLASTYIFNRYTASDQAVSIDVLELIDKLSLFWSSEEEIELDDFTQISSYHIIEYLSRSHRLYMHVKIPEIASYLFKLKNTGLGWIAREVSECLSRYMQDIEEHFHYEEEELFPILLELEQSPNPDVSALAMQISRFEHSHDDVHDELEELIAMLDRYISNESYVSMEIRVLIEKLRAFHQDISLHEALEHKVVLPRLVALISK